MPKRKDPIRENFYKQLEHTESVLSWLFYMGAFLSFALLFMDQKIYSQIYQITTITFILVVIAFFLLGIISRYYLFTRAEDARRADFLSYVSGVNITHQKTVGYYNNKEIEVDSKLMITVLENTFFSKSILLAMLKIERIKMIIYVFVFMIFILNRTTPLDLIATVAQVIFSEEIIVKWIRMEWLRMRVESIYDKTYSLFHSKPSNEIMQVRGLEAFGNYECGKALGGILLSAKIFEKMNPKLTTEWEWIKKNLPIHR